MINALFDLSKDVGVVTGAGRGIGEGIARTLAGAGAAVVVAARRTDEIEKVAAAIRGEGGRALAVTTDVTDQAAVEALAGAAIDAFGGLDIWVNNAGGSPVQLNLTAVWVCTTVAAQHMEDGGRVVNISSRAAVGGMAGSGHYAAAKAGVNSLTETFAQELGPRVRVNGIMPGAVPTEIMMTALKLSEDDLPGLEQNLRLPLRRLGTPEDLVAAALYLASPASSWVTGQTISVTGGM